METKYGFTKFSVQEFLSWIGGISVARTLDRVQQHHTWKPRYSGFGGNNHFELQRSMKRHHVDTNGWSDIGQHFTIFPDGMVMTGRPLNRSPACIYGANSGAVCIENLGNFDAGGDTMLDEQKQAIFRVTAALLERFGLGEPSEDNIVYHHWYDSNGNKKFGVDGVKSCPGTAFIGGNKLPDFKEHFLPGVRAALGGASPGPVGVVKWIHVDADWLPIRAEAASDAKIIDRVGLGAILRVFEERDRWYRVSNTKSHWVYSRNTHPVRRATVNTIDTNCRTGPGMQFDIVEVYNKGDRVFVHGRRGNWLSIGPDQWIHETLLGIDG